MKNVEPMKDREFLIGGNVLTLITKGGNVELCQTGGLKKTEERAHNQSFHKERKSKAMRKGILIEIIFSIVLLIIIGIFFSKRMNIKEPKISPLILSKVGTQQHEIEEIIWEEIPEKKLDNSRIIEELQVEEELSYAGKPVKINESQIEEKTLYVEQELLVPDVTVDKTHTQAFRAPVEKKPKHDVTVKSITHKVQSGDSLYRIADKYYGDPTMWEKIYEANKETIEDKDLLRKGQNLIIPQ